jgi:hypothetical protein
MNGINPNDPVVSMLKSLVSQFEEKGKLLEDRVLALEEALHLLMGGNQKIITNLNARIVALEATLAATRMREEQDGKEL